MCFKKAILISQIIFVLCACDLKTNEKPPEKKPIQPKIEGLGCLDNAKETIKRYFEGVAQPEEVLQFWSCADLALSEFKLKVRGEQNGVYSPYELKNFLQSFYLQDIELTDTLINEAMKIKQVFIGGPIDKITNQDLELTIQKYIPAFKEMTLNLLPYMKVYTQNWVLNGYDKENQDTQYFEDANLALQKFAKDISAIITPHEQSYELDHFVILLSEFADVFNKEWPIVVDAPKYLPLIKKLKASLAGGNENIVKSDEWHSFLLLGLRGYIQYLRYYYFIKNVPEDIGNAIQIHFMAKTVDDTFSLLSDIVDTKKPIQKLTRHELFEIFSNFSVLFEDLKVSEVLVLEFMKIKRVFLGGSIEEWTPDEFRYARTKVEKFKNIVEEADPYFNFYSLSWVYDQLTEKQKQDFTELALNQLKKTMLDVSQLTESSYDLRDLETLLNELINLYPEQIKVLPTEEPIQMDFARDILKWVPVLIEVKKLIYAQGDSFIYPKQWQLILDKTSLIFSEALRYYYFVPETNILEAFKNPYFTQAFVNMSGVVDEFIRLQKNAVIKWAQIDSLVDSLYVHNPLELKIQNQNLKNLSQVLISKILTTVEQRFKNIKVEGLTVAATEVLRNELSHFNLTQNFIKTNTENLNEPYDKNQLSQVFKAQALVWDTPAHPVIGLQDFVKVIETPFSLHQTSNNILLLDPKSMTYYSLASVYNLNTFRFLSRQLVKSYAGELERAQKVIGISVEEAQLAFDDFKNVFFDLQLIDPSNITFAESRFLEANLFTPHSNGDEWADQSELSDLVAFIYSGIKSEEQVNADLLNLCPKTELPNKDYTIDISCFRSSYKQLVQKYFVEKPEFLKYIAQLSENKWMQYLLGLEKSAGYNGTDPQIKHFDYSLVPYAIQYIEMMMFTFDKNKNNYLDTEESLASLPLLRKTLEEVSGLKSEKSLAAVLTFFLKHGREPTPFEFIKWRIKGRKDWNVNAGREQLASVLGYIKEESLKEADKRGRLGDEVGDE